jgi:hypothetical protein
LQQITIARIDADDKLVPDEQLATKLADKVNEEILDTATDDFDLHRDDFFAMIQRESGVDMYVRLKERSSRMNGTVQDEINRMIKRYYTSRTVATVKRQIGHYQMANPKLSGTATVEIGASALMRELRGLLRDQHLWLVNRMGYSYILIGVQDLQCYDETCEELIDGNDLHELGKAFVVKLCCMQRVVVQYHLKIIHLDHTTKTRHHLLNLCSTSCISKLNM